MSSECLFIFSEDKPFKPLPLNSLMKKFSIRSPSWWAKTKFLMFNLLHSFFNRKYRILRALNWILDFGILPFQVNILVLILCFVKIFLTFRVSIPDCFLKLWSIIKATNLLLNFFEKILLRNARARLSGPPDTPMQNFSFLIWEYNCFLKVKYTFLIFGSLRCYFRV